MFVEDWGFVSCPLIHTMSACIAVGFGFCVSQVYPVCASMKTHILCLELSALAKCKNSCASVCYRRRSPQHRCYL